MKLVVHGRVIIPPFPPVSPHSGHLIFLCHGHYGALVGGAWATGPSYPPLPLRQPLGEGRGGLQGCTCWHRGPAQHQPPSLPGEIPLQNLNAVLCLSHLQRASDAIVLFSNDEVMALLSEAKQRPITTTDINEYICACLLATLQWGKGEEALATLIATLAPDPHLKFLTMYKYPPVWGGGAAPAEHVTRWTDFMDRACSRMGRWDVHSRRIRTLHSHVTVSTNEARPHPTS